MLVKHISSIVDVYPRVLPVGKTVQITIAPHFSLQLPSQLMKRGKLGMKFICNNRTQQNGEYVEGFYSKRTFEELPFRIEEEKILFSFTPWIEEEYTVVVYIVDQNGNEIEQFSFNVYALEEDLFALRPYKGDFHVHSSWSQCGKVDEPPEFLLMTALDNGLDFFALTDHCQYGASQYLQKWCSESGSSFTVLSGEECHTPREYVESFFRNNAFLSANHIVHVGGRTGILDYIMAHYDEYLQYIEAKSAQMPQNLGVQMRAMMASSDYIIDKIHEFGGIAIFAHPFWMTGHRNNLPQPLREYIMNQGKFDALEILGLALRHRGEDNTNEIYREGNAIATAWWQQESIKRGRLIPIVGSTDTHFALEILGRQFSFVFAKDHSSEAICDAVKAGRVIAFSNYENDKVPFAFGDFRLMKYAFFVFRELCPEHDRFCKGEAALIAEYIKGRASAKEIKEYSQGRLEAFFNHVFA